MADGYTVFSTPLGHCAIAWSPRGITHVHLPESDAAATDVRMAERSSAARADPPPWVADVVARITRSLEGHADPFADIPLDLATQTDFRRAVLLAARTVGHGNTTTYGGLADSVGSPGAARAVGQAMANNPVPLLVPCHRVLGSGKSPGGFTSAGGVATKARLLAGEGVTLPGSPAPPSPDARARGLEYDPDVAAETLSRADRRLAKVIASVGPMVLRADPLQSPYAALARAIVYQQLAGAAAATIYGRVQGLFPGGTLGTPAELLALSDDPLRAAGLSRNKLLALRDLATKSLDGTVPDLTGLKNLPDDAIIQRLTAIRGVGQWTVEMMLIFKLGRPDVLPAGDYGVRKGFQKVWKLSDPPSPGDLALRGLRWKPYRSVAAWYLWRALDT